MNHTGVEGCRSRYDNFKKIVIHLYDIAVAINFSMITSRAARTVPARASVYSMYDTRPVRMYVCTLWRCLLCKMY